MSDADNSKMHSSVANDPMHGVTLKTVVTELQERYGWQELGRRVPLKCFTNNPSLNSSLKFLRNTPWAREKVEALYLASISSAATEVSQPDSGDVWQAWRSTNSSGSGAGEQAGSDARTDSDRKMDGEGAD